MTTIPTISVNDIVLHYGEPWTVEGVRGQFDGRAMVADLREWGGMHRSRERSVCFWRAEGETRPLAWSPDGVLEQTGRRISLHQGAYFVEVTS